MPELVKSVYEPRHAALDSFTAAATAYDEVFAQMQEDAVTFSTEMESAESHPDRAFNDPQPYLRHDSIKSYRVAYYAIRSSTKYGGQEALADVCYELREERRNQSWGRTAREYGAAVGLSQRRQQSMAEKQQIAILSMRNGDGKLAIVTEHLHGNANQRLRVSTWDLTADRFLDSGLKNGLVALETVLRSWTSDLAVARDKYLRG
jgi:hypothetical protein